MASWQNLCLQSSITENKNQKLLISFLKTVLVIEHYLHNHINTIKFYTKKSQKLKKKNSPIFFSLFNQGQKSVEAN